MKKALEVNLLLDAKIQDNLNWKDYCQSCHHFEIESGDCTKIKYNTRSYPDEFLKRCASKYYE
jgi:hypothetical protein